MGTDHRVAEGADGDQHDRRANPFVGPLVGELVAEGDDERLHRVAHRLEMAEAARQDDPRRERPGADAVEGLKQAVDEDEGHAIVALARSDARLVVKKSLSQFQIRWVLY